MRGSCNVKGAPQFIKDAVTRCRSGHKRKHKMPFRLDASYWFITYSQCPLEREFVLEEIYTRHDTRQPEWIIVARERHDDGRFHLHALLFWGKRFCTRNPRFLDITGPDGTVYHPKLEPVKHLGKTLNYIYKEDTNPVEFGTIPDPSTTERDARGDTIRRLLATATSAEELLSSVRDEDPVHYVEKIFQWERVAQRKFEQVVDPDPVEQRPFHNIPADIQGWLDTEFKTEVSRFLYVWRGCRATPFGMMRARYPRTLK